MRVDRHDLHAFASRIEGALPAALEQIRAQHPLLRHVTFTAVSRIGVPVDVNADRPAIATYELPRLSSGVSLEVDSTVTTIDCLAEATTAIIDYAVFEYERDIRTGLYAPANGFLGVGGLLPPAVGGNIIGGIDEASTPGWRSQVTATQPSMYRAFVASEARCIARGKAPDLTLLGTDGYRSLVVEIQPQQRFTTIRAGIPMLQLHAGGLFHDPFCDANTGYMLHAEDFQFLASPFDIVADVGIDGRIRIHVLRREQMIARRRFRSGTITPLQATAAANVSHVTRDRSRVTCMRSARHSRTR
jgi:hypothetical protein